MLHFEAEFPEGTLSKELYEILKPYGLHVTEMIFLTIVYGEIKTDDL